MALVALTRSGSRTPIFAVHNGAGSAYHYVPLARALGPDQPFYVFQQFELAHYQKPPPSVEAMADEYVTAVQDLRPAGPYVFAGICATGAYVAYEMAQRTRALGEEVELVLLLDPMNSEIAQECSQSLLLLDQAIEVAHRMSRLPDSDTQAVRLRRELSRLIWTIGVDPKLLEITPQLATQFLELFASNHRASLNYAPAPYAGRAIIFLGSLPEGRSRAPNSSPWETLTPAAEIHLLPIDFLESFGETEIVTCVATAVESATS